MICEICKEPVYVPRTGHYYREFSGHPIDMSSTIGLCKQITEKLKNENQGPGTKFPPVPRD